MIGCSNETTWGLMKSLSVSEREGLARFETIQNNFSLINRRFEDELAQACRQEGVSLIPFSPLGGGVLSGKYSGGKTPDGARFSNYLKLGGRQATMARRYVNDKSLSATDRFAAIRSSCWSSRPSAFSSSVATTSPVRFESMAMRDPPINCATPERRDAGSDGFLPMG